MTAKEKIKNKNNTVRLNKDLLEMYTETKETLQEREKTYYSDGVFWITCLNIALSRPIEPELLETYENLNIKKTVRVNQEALNSISWLKNEIGKYATIRDDVSVWRYCLRVAYSVVVGSGDDGR